MPRHKTPHANFCAYRRLKKLSGHLRPTCMHASNVYESPVDGVRDFALYFINPKGIIEMFRNLAKGARGEKIGRTMPEPQNS